MDIKLRQLSLYEVYLQLSLHTIYLHATAHTHSARNLKTCPPCLRDVPHTLLFRLQKGSPRKPPGCSPFYTISRMRMGAWTTNISKVVGSIAWLLKNRGSHSPLLIGNPWLKQLGIRKHCGSVGNHRRTGWLLYFKADHWCISPVLCAL